MDSVSGKRSFSKVHGDLTDSTDTMPDLLHEDDFENLAVFENVQCDVLKTKLQNARNASEWWNAIRDHNWAIQPCESFKYNSLDSFVHNPHDDECVETIKPYLLDILNVMKINPKINDLYETLYSKFKTDYFAYLYRGGYFLQSSTILLDTEADDFACYAHLKQYVAEAEIVEVCNVKRENMIIQKTHFMNCFKKPIFPKKYGFKWGWQQSATAITDTIVLEMKLIDLVFYKFNLLPKTPYVLNANNEHIQELLKLLKQIYAQLFLNYCTKTISKYHLGIAYVKAYTSVSNDKTYYYYLEHSFSEKKKGNSQNVSNHDKRVHNQYVKNNLLSGVQFEINKLIFESIPPAEKLLQPPPPQPQPHSSWWARMWWPFRRKTQTKEGGSRCRRSHHHTNRRKRGYAMQSRLYRSRCRRRQQRRMTYRNRRNGGRYGQP